MTQILEQKTKRKKQQWQQIIDTAKEALKNNDKTKKDIIRKTAELLENNGMPLGMVCGAISREFHEFASKSYIWECLDSKYKDSSQSHPTAGRKRTDSVSKSDDDKNVIEEKEDEEPLEMFQIRPEDYLIEDLPKYPSELKDRIIVYLDEEVRKLREQSTS
jgi:hypothetical protein